MVRSLFGTLRLASPRWWHCDCRDQPARTFQPLAGLLRERAIPELAYLQVLPLGRRLHPAVVRRTVHAVADRLEGELGEERPSFIDTCQRDREELPRPDLPIVVGLDGGYVHSSQQQSRTDGWFEVIAGKAIPADGRPACFGYVQTYDTKPKRRLFDVLRSQGMQAMLLAIGFSWAANPPPGTRHCSNARTSPSSGCTPTVTASPKPGTAWYASRTGPVIDVSCYCCGNAP